VFSPAISGGLAFSGAETSFFLGGNLKDKSLILREIQEIGARKFVAT
jgi:hypothetical protein